jgi:predicted permease
VRTDPGLGIGLRLYRLLLFCFPGSVRREFGQEMLDLLADLREAERHRRGWTGVMWVSLKAYVEVPMKAWAAHSEMRRRARRVRGREGRSPSGRLRGGPGGIGTELATFLHDLRYALRRLARSPGFTTVAILSLAIGIGANTAIFSVINAVLIRGRPYQEVEGLVHVYTSHENGSPYGISSYPDLLDLRALDDLFADVGAFSGHLSRTLDGGEARPVHVEGVTHNLFPMLGLQAAVGRTFLPEEDEVPGARAVAILNWGYWHRRYGEDPSVLGQTVEIAGRPFTVVGVTPERYESFLAPGVRSDIIIPMMMTGSLSEESSRAAYTDRGARGIKIMGRLRPGVPLEQARSRAEGLSAQLQAAYPEHYQGRSFNVVFAADVAVQPDIDEALAYIGALLMTMVGLVLLLACTNLATFLLARGLDRKREIAVRLALGARRVLALIGGAAGLLLARWSLDLLAGTLPPTYIPVTVDYGLDGTVLLFTLGVATLAGVLAGLVPTLQSTNPDVAPTLKDEAVPGKQRRYGLQKGLVAVQVAISMVLLVCGGLFVRSLTVAQEIDPGFTTREAGMVWVDLQTSGIPPSEWHAVTEELLARARSLPGIEAVGSSTSVPLTQGGWSAPFTIPGVDPPEGWDSHRVAFGSIDPDFFEVVGISLVAGRGITRLDREGTEPVVVVNEAAVRRFWPGEDALGREIVAMRSGLSHRVVGVAGDTKSQSLDDAPEPLFYFSHAQLPAANVRLVARGLPTPPEIAAALRRSVREVDTDLVIIAETTLDEQLSVVLFPARLAAGLLSVFGLLAMGLASIGLYGVVSFAVSRRTREVGIRMSLGADAGEVVGMVIRSAMGMVLVGAAIGLVTTLGLSRLLDWFLIGIGPYDLVTFAAVPLVLCSVALLAAFVPARRAARVNPVRALRCD